MKSKDYIILGTAVAVYLLWKNSKTKKTTTSTTTGGGVTAGGGATGGGTTTPTKSEPEQVYGLDLPTGMDLPVLTAGTGTPTEVGVQQGLGTTTPIPVVAPIKEVSTEEILVMDGIKPIVKDTTPQVLDIPQTPIIPTTQPTEIPKDEVKEEIKGETRSECGNSFSIPNYDKEGASTSYWFDGKFYYSQNTNPFIKLVRTQISETQFREACKKLQTIKMQSTKA
jgi:hypothetical protein